MERVIVLFILPCFKINHANAVVHLHIFQPINESAENDVVLFRKVKIWRHAVLRLLQFHRLLRERPGILDYSINHRASARLRYRLFLGAGEATLLAGYFRPLLFKIGEQVAVETFYNRQCPQRFKCRVYRRAERERRVHNRNLASRVRIFIHIMQIICTRAFQKVPNG